MAQNDNASTLNSLSSKINNKFTGTLIPNQCSSIKKIILQTNVEPCTVPRTVPRTVPFICKHQKEKGDDYCDMCQRFIDELILSYDPPKQGVASGY